MALGKPGACNCVPAGDRPFLATGQVVDRTGDSLRHFRATRRPGWEGLIERPALSSQTADQDSPHASKRDADDDHPRRLGPWPRHSEDEDADARIDQQTELRNGEAHAGTHPCDQPKQGKIANAEENTGGDLYGGNPRAQPCRPTRCRDQQRSGGEYAKSQGEVSQLRRYFLPLRRHEVTAPQYAGGTGKQIPATVATSRSRDRGFLW